MTVQIIHFACAARNETADGRCRFPSMAGKKFCHIHQKMLDDGKEVALSPEPDTVLVKIPVHEKLMEQIKAIGIPVIEQNREEKKESHIAHANELGRDSSAYGKVDSGTAPWGKDRDLARWVPVNAHGLVRELAAELSWVSAHVQKTQRPKYWDERKKGPWLPTLVVSFSKEKQGDYKEDAVDQLLEILDLSELLYPRMCQPYVNSRRKDKTGREKILHSFKVGKQVNGDSLPKALFAKGQWLLG